MSICTLDIKIQDPINTFFIVFSRDHHGSQQTRTILTIGLKYGFVSPNISIQLMGRDVSTVDGTLSK